MSASLRIGDLARETNTKVVTIRYYEKIGLMPKPDRGAGNYRAYGTYALDRLRFIRRCRGLGFSLEQVSDLLTLASDTGHTCSAVDRLTSEHLAEVERKIADLTRLADELRRVAASCKGGGTIANCRIIEAITPSG